MPLTQFHMQEELNNIQCFLFCCDVFFKLHKCSSSDNWIVKWQCTNDKWALRKVKIDNNFQISESGKKTL